MPDYPIVVDISNYDFDADLNHPQWVQQFEEAGISGVIVGSQWESKAESQLQALRDGGLSIIGTYAEPDADSAISLALQFGCKYVGLACERGSIVTHEELARDITSVYNAGLTPWLYGNSGDLESIAANFLSTELVWLANYGMDDPANPRSPITSYTSPFYGPVHLAAHQYSSTIVVAGRVRDHSYYFLENDMTPDEVQALIDKTISDKLYNSQLIDSSQVPELVAQILGVHTDGYTDKATRAINDEIRAAVFPDDTPSTAAVSATPTQEGTNNSNPTGFTLSGGKPDA